MDKKIKGCSDKVVFRTPGPPISMLMRFCFLVCAALWFVLYLRLGSRMMRNIEIGGTGGLTLSILWFYCPSTVSGGARIPGQNIFKCFFCNTWALINLKRMSVFVCLCRFFLRMLSCSRKLEIYGLLKKQQQVPPVPDCKAQLGPN